MKRRVVLIALLTLALFTVACATATPQQTVRGTISSLEGNQLTVTPDGGAPVTLTIGGVTRIWKGGVEADNSSVLASGQNVQVFFEGTRATKVLVTQ